MVQVRFGRGRSCGGGRVGHAGEDGSHQVSLPFLVCFHCLSGANSGALSTGGERPRQVRAAAADVHPLCQRVQQDAGADLSLPFLVSSLPFAAFHCVYFRCLSQVQITKLKEGKVKNADGKTFAQFLRDQQVRAASPAVLCKLTLTLGPPRTPTPRTECGRCAGCGGVWGAAGRGAAGAGCHLCGYRSCWTAAKR